MDYYYFYNISRNEHNKCAIPGYGDHNCVKQLYKFDDDDIKKIFQSMIRINKNWGRNDEISAASANEDNAVILYCNDELSFRGAFEERETNAPFDDMDIVDDMDVADYY
jgi:hypothetical protein